MQLPPKQINGFATWSAEQGRLVGERPQHAQRRFAVRHQQGHVQVAQGNALRALLRVHQVLPLVRRPLAHRYRAFLTTHTHTV